DRGVEARALEDVVGRHVDRDEEVPPRRARIADVPLPDEPELHPAVDARRHRDLDLLGDAGPPGAVAGLAAVLRRDAPPLAAARGADRADAEEALRLDHLTRAAAG